MEFYNIKGSCPNPYLGLKLCFGWILFVKVTPSRPSNRLAIHPTVHKTFRYAWLNYKVVDVFLFVLAQQWP